MPVSGPVPLLSLHVLQINSAVAQRPDGGSMRLVGRRGGTTIVGVARVNSSKRKFSDTFTIDQINTDFYLYDL